MMRRLVVLCLIMLVTAHVSSFIGIVLGADGDAINKWLTLTDAAFCTELLGMLLKRILENKSTNIGE